MIVELDANATHSNADGAYGDRGESGDEREAAVIALSQLRENMHGQRDGGPKDNAGGGPQPHGT